MLREGYKLSIFDPAIDASKLVGANLGYAYTQLPSLRELLVGQEEVNLQAYDRVILTNATGKLLNIADFASVVDLSSLA